MAASASTIVSAATSMAAQPGIESGNPTMGCRPAP